MRTSEHKALFRLKEALEQVNGVTVAELRPDLNVKMKKHITSHTSASPAAGGK